MEDGGAELRGGEVVESVAAFEISTAIGDAKNCYLALLGIDLKQDRGASLEANGANAAPEIIAAAAALRSQRKAEAILLDAADISGGDPARSAM